MFNRIDDEDDFYDAVYSLRRTHPSVRLLIVTRNSPASAFSRFVLSPGHDVFVLSQLGQELLAEADGRRIARRIAQARHSGCATLSFRNNFKRAFQIPGQIKYSDCRDEDDTTLGEKTSEEVLYVLPGTQRFLEVDPKYLEDSDELQITFVVRYNSVRICWSRASPEEQVIRMAFFWMSVLE
jgi:hypothetical protein